LVTKGRNRRGQYAKREETERQQGVKTSITKGPERGGSTEKRIRRPSGRKKGTEASGRELEQSGEKSNDWMR